MHPMNGFARPLIPRPSVRGTGAGEVGDSRQRNVARDAVVRPEVFVAEAPELVRNQPESGSILSSPWGRSSEGLDPVAKATGDLDAPQLESGVESGLEFHGGERFRV